MEEYNYNFEIYTLLMNFMAAFDDVRIKRFNGEHFEKEVIKVPITFSPKSSILADLISKTDTVRLPIMAVRKLAERRSKDRVKNKLEDINYKNSDGTYVTLRAVPWDIDVELTILAKYQEDVDQIVQNFAMQCTPYIPVSWQEPKSGREIRSHIMWSGEISYELPGDNQTPKDFPFRVTATTKFTIEGWLYQTVLENVKPICKLNTDFIFTNSFYCNYETLVEKTSGSLTDSYSITGRPILRYISPYYTRTQQTPSITIQGYGFGEVTSLYVSGTSDNYPLTEYDPLSSGETFRGFMIDEFSKTNNSITFTLPPASALGFVDIIAVNSCGFGRLTVDANRCSRVENPYPVNDPEHYNWCVLQFPYLNGIIVSDEHNNGYTIDETKQTIIIDEEPDREAIIEKILELMALGQITVDDLQ